MPHYKTLIDTDYLGQWDFPPGKDATVTIESVSRFRPKRPRMVRQSDGSFAPEKSRRWVIRFVGKKKPWLAGVVSTDALARMFGTNYESWYGKKITLYVDHDVTFGNGRNAPKVGGVRVRPMAATGPDTADELDRAVDDDKAEKIAEFFDEADDLHGS